MGQSCTNSSAIIMKFLVLAACVCQSLAAPQGFFGLQGHPNGAVTPLDEPRVAALKADHLTTKYGHGGVVAAAHHGVAHAVPAIAHAAVPAVPAVHHAAPVAVAHHGYAGPLHIPLLVAHPNGAVTPADEPAVVAARADHLAAKGAAFQAAVLSGPGLVGPVAGPAFAPAPIAPAVRAIGPIAPAVRAIAPALPYAGPLAGVPALVAHPNGAVVPADEPAVVAARADHLRSKGIPFHG